MKKLVTILCLWLASVALFWQAAGHGYILEDDGADTYANPNVTPPTREGLATIWKEPYEGLYIPVAYSVWWLETAIAQRGQDSPPPVTDPTVYHLGNIFLHATNVGLVFLSLSFLFEGTLAPLLGSLAFAVHPIHAEPVAWVAGLRDVLSGTFGLLTLYLYLCFLKQKNESFARRALLFAASFFSFNLGLLSKPSLAALPLALGAIEIGLLRRPFRKAAAHLGIWLVPVAIIAWVTHGEQPVDNSLVFSWTQRVRVAADAFGFYVVKFLVPYPLLPDYARSPAWALREGGFFFCLVSLATALAATFTRDRRFWLSALIIFLSGVLPVLGLVPFYFQNFSTVADRYAYVSSVALALGVAYFVSRVRPQAALATVALVLIAWTALTFRQTGLWQDSDTLFRYTLEYSPRSSLANEAMGMTLFNRGDVAQATEHLKAAVRQNGEWPPFRYALGTALKEQGALDEAKREFLVLVGQNESDLRFQDELAQLEIRTGHPAGAIEPLKRILSIVPFARSYNLLGIAYFETGQQDLSVGAFSQGTIRFPQAAGLYLNWGTALERMGKKGEALTVYRKLLERDPEGPAKDRLAALGGVKPAGNEPWIGDPRSATPSE